MQIISLFKLIGIAGMSLIMSIYSAFAPAKDTPDPNAGSTSQSQSQQEKQISLDAAIDIALADAGVARSDARFTETKLDSDELIPHYDIEFIASSKEYDYEIAVSDGRILKKDVEKAGSSATTQESSPAASGYISVDEAKAIALKKVSLEASQVTFKKAERDTDDQIAHYDIEFVSGNYEYEFEINAKTGAIIEFDKELEISKPVDTSIFITVDEAKTIALKKASLVASQVTFTKAKLDTDGLVAHYDIEFVSGNYEYEFEINAKTGTVIKFEKERADNVPADTSKYISADAAKNAALAHAGLTAAQVTELEAELDTDSLTAHYDVDFKYGGFEYEYKINATSGKVISVEKERD